MDGSGQGCPADGNHEEIGRLKTVLVMHKTHNSSLGPDVAEMQHLAVSGRLRSVKSVISVVFYCGQMGLNLSRITPAIRVKTRKR